jgi:hypothetical protein
MASFLAGLLEPLTTFACPADAVGCSDVGVASSSWVPAAIVILAVLMVVVAVLAFRRR